jgi:DNA repair exonuclease SbcCD ATPase subunit
MNEVQASDQFAILEQKAVKYAIAVEAREAVHTYLKLWGTLFAVVTTGAGIFGFSLSRNIASLHSSAAAESRRLNELQQKTSDMDTRLADKEKTLENKASKIAERADQLQGHADKMTLQAAQFADAAISFNDRRLDVITQLAKAANESKQSASEAKEHLSATTSFRNAAATASELAKAEAERLETTMKKADIFEAQLATQQRIFRDALLDYVTLTSSAESPELTLLTPLQCNRMPWYS